MSGKVYFLSTEDGSVKIGWTGGEPDERAAQLQTGSPAVIRVLTWAPGTQGDERLLHQAFRHSKLRGEWFKPDAQLSEMIATIQALDAEKRRAVFEGIMIALAEAANARSKNAPSRIYQNKVDVKAIRRRLKMTQIEFASRFGFSVASVRDWEQNRYAPDGAARAYLIVIDREPEAVQQALATRTSPSLPTSISHA